MEDTLEPEDFPAFFRALWGYEPFPWQADLVQRLAADGDRQRRETGTEPAIWPDVLDLPTGAGKTAALDIAVFHLALEAVRGRDRLAPVRIAFVVDRRLIVDDAFARARQFCRALRWSLLDGEAANDELKKTPEREAEITRVRAEPAVRRTALRLGRLAGHGQPPLIARSLRGGVPREDDWARTPAQPTILCSTVDQVGSRLLFRGYGVSDAMKPIHAGLLGSDCLVLLDEAHLSAPFRETLESIARLRRPDTAPFGVALLTATPAVTAARGFALSPADRAHPVLSARINAAKPARLVEFSGRQGLDREAARADAIAAEAIEMLAALRTAMVNPAVAVVVNRVARARAVFERLESQFPPVAGSDGARAPEVDVRLIIGLARSVDRDRIAASLDPIRTAAPDALRRLERPLVIVATQTIEAGVDIDFDGLVTEVAALDALRQRFGRLNRAGRPIAPAAVVLAHKDDVGAKADDPVYGTRIAATWNVLERIAAETGIVDFGVAALAARLDPAEAAELAAPTARAPVLPPAYADLWSQTSPIPACDPEVALFLHGAERSPASVQIVWRGDIDEDELGPAGSTRLIQRLALLRPRAAEAIEVPIWAARAFLRREIAGFDALSDATEREPAGIAAGRSRLAFRYAGADSPDTKTIHSGRLRAGDLIVVPAAYGGCDQHGWNPDWTGPVPDVADEAARPYAARYFAVRVTSQLIDQGLTAQGTGDQAPVDDLAAKLLEHAEDRTPRLLDAVLELELPDSIKKSLGTLKEHGRGCGHAFAYGVGGEPTRGVVFFAARGIAPALADANPNGSEEEFDAATESDETGAFAERAVTLCEHSKHVRDWADDFASRAGLSADTAKDVALAAALHDLGKADPRYQAYYAGGDPYGPDSDQVLAKSGERRLPRDAWERAGLPSRWRHEALSVRLAMIHREFGRAADPALVLWLVGSHHGYGRPFFPHCDEADSQARRGLLAAFGQDRELEPGFGPQSLAFTFEGYDWAQTFELLKARYGIWGLARLEAFVRLADHRASGAGRAPGAEGGE
jgi:CRISPR-associated endonuclease/helicase Cas3